MSKTLTLISEGFLYNINSCIDIHFGLILRIELKSDDFGLGGKT